MGTAPPPGLTGHKHSIIIAIIASAPAVLPALMATIAAEPHSFFHLQYRHRLYSMNYSTISSLQKEVAHHFQARQQST